MRTCPVCKIEKEVDEYFKSSRRCKACDRLKGIKWWRSDRGRFATLKRVAKAKGLQVEIDFPQYYSIISNPCRYCGSLLNQQTTTYFLDRKNSTLGYSIDNIVPCCHTCNFMKGTMNEREFIDSCLRVATYLRMLQ